MPKMYTESPGIYSVFGWIFSPSSIQRALAWLLTPVLLMLTLLGTTLAHSAPVMLYEASEQLLITNNLSMYEDTSGELSAEEVVTPAIRQSFTQIHSNSLFFKASDSTYWIRVDLYNSLPNSRLSVLSLSNGHVGNPTLYRVDRSASIDLPGSGFQIFPRSQGSFPLAHAWTLELAPQEPQTYLIRLQSNLPLNSDVRIQSMDHFIQDEQRTSLIVGLLVGWLLATSAFFIHLALNRQSSLSAWAAVACVFSSGFAFGLIGYFGLLLDVTARTQTTLTQLCVSGALIAQIMMAYFLPWRGNDAAGIRKLLTAMAMIAGLVATLSLAMGGSQTVLTTQTLIAIGGLLLTALLLWGETDFPQAQKWLTVSAGLLFLGPVLSVLSINSLVGSNLIPSPWISLFTPLLITGFNVVAVFQMTRTNDAYLERKQVGVSIAPSILSQISHALRSPINGIQGMNDLLNETPLSQDQLNYSATIRQSSREVLHVANEISHLAKFHEHENQVEQKDLRIGQLLDKAVQHFRADAVMKGVELVVDKSDNLQNQLLVDRHRLPTLIHNLISSLLAYMEQGELVIHVSYRPSRSKDMGTACIQFQMIGEVTNKEFLRQLLQGLERPPKPIEQETSWKNLVTSQLISYLQASVELESLSGNGGSLTLYAPVLQRSPTPSVHQLPDDSLVGLSLLVVDDSAALRDVVEKQVARWGVQAESTHSGKEALALMRSQSSISQPYETVIIDQQMPIMDGIELARRIRDDNSIEPKPSLLMLTGMSISSVENEANAAGIHHILSKPADSDSLKQALLTLKYRPIKPDDESINPLDSGELGTRE
jgi:CheY-like chemotaxis protein/signal transduction histidine kinase